jgi:hypothetical protein
MTDEPKYPSHYNAELIDQYETYMRDQKAAPQASKPATLETEEKPKSEPAAAAEATVPFEPAFFNPDDLTQVPGVVGMLIDWTVRSALYPNRTLALGGALVTVGTLMGRRVMTPTRGVTHLYVVGVAESGTGKQHPADCLKEALTVAGNVARALRRDQVVGRTRQDSLGAGTASLLGYRRVRSGAGSAGALERYQFGNEPDE